MLLKNKGAISVYNIVYVNGEFVEKENAKVSVFDHGFLYGDGVFEGIRVYSGVAFFLREHLERLVRSAKSIFMEVPYSLEEIEEIVYQTIAKNNCTNKNGYIRLVLSRGQAPLGADPMSGLNANLIVILEDVTLFSEEVRNKGIDVISVPTRKPKQDTLNTQAKTLNYLNNQMCKLEAKIAGADEAIVLDSNGYVCEGSKENIFILKDDEVHTPPCYLGVLEGITRNIVIKLLRNKGIKVIESVFTMHDIYNAEEVFLTGTGAEIIEVRKADHRIIGNDKPGKLTAMLQNDYQEVIQKYNENRTLMNSI